MAHEPRGPAGRPSGVARASALDVGGAYRNLVITLIIMAALSAWVAVVINTHGFGLGGAGHLLTEYGYPHP
jgi:hypothetical protein